jgi:Zn finger protein HypA/HybF involved in hydrogenase expression
LGCEYKATCKECGKRFRIHEGGGFAFHLLHCNKCGKERSISFERLGEIHYRYLKGLSGPYSIATSSSDRHIQQNYAGTPLSEEEYYVSVEKIVGKCRCGGQFEFNASARCPKCKSTNLDVDRKEPSICYD